MKWFSLFALVASCLCTAGYAKSTAASDTFVQKAKKIYQAETIWTVPSMAIAIINVNAPLPLGTPLTLDGFRFSKDGQSIKVKHTDDYVVQIGLNLGGVSSFPDLVLVVQGSSDNGKTWSNMASFPVTANSSGFSFEQVLDNGTWLRLLPTSGLSGNLSGRGQVLDFRIYTAPQKQSA